MLTDGLILALIFCGALTLVGLKLRARQVVWISSIGELIAALQIYQETEAALPMILLIMIAFVQVFLVGGLRRGL